jgi:pimeloyl-ACP methyl ester carboxylesterase
LIQKDFKQIEDIPCLVIWGEKDNLVPIEYYYKFKQQLPKANYATIADAGHAVVVVEKTATVYEKLRTFLMQDEASVA